MLLKVDTPIGSFQIEAGWVGASRTARPCMVFLHEGLGSVSMWRDFPARLCDALDVRGLVYSRPGYGASSPRPPGQAWGPRFMHDQARHVLPAVLRAAGVTAPPWLFGHSDGGSIALLHAALCPGQQRGLVVLAPHTHVEDCSLKSIALARQAYATGTLRERLARYHQDVDSAFYGWNDVWLSPAFRDWSIEAELGSIQVPVLAVQGRDDEYGTLAQIEGIAQRVPDTQLGVIEDCGHSPHRDQPERLIEITSRFFQLSDT